MDQTSSQHKRCVDCAYILDGLPMSRCPECGREFDPDNADTYDARIELKPTVGIWQMVLSLAAWAWLVCINLIVDIDSISAAADAVIVLSVPICQLIALVGSIRYVSYQRGLKLRIAPTVAVASSGVYFLMLMREIMFG